MAVEIERKFVVINDEWQEQAEPGRRFCQGHVLRNGEKSVRVRRAHDKAYITVKGKKVGLARLEFEYEIPVDDAEDMLKTLCPRPLLEKTRYCVKHQGMNWEVDVFMRPKGLVVAEIELDSAGQQFALPTWVGKEVTYDPRYRSSAIADGAS